MNSSNQVKRLILTLIPGSGNYATSESDFDIALLKTSKATIYVGSNSTDIERLKPLMPLFYNHAFERLVKTAESLGYGKENCGVTVMLDEFYTIGKLEKYAFAYPKRI